MKYTVVWKPDAEDELARLWNNAPDRAAVAAAADRIDATLLHDPETQGESRSGNIRVLFMPPLAVYFRVSPDDRLVEVAAVWRSH
jgi:plasmid stabilization system protein ParE